MFIIKLLFFILLVKWTVLGKNVTEKPCNETLSCAGKCVSFGDVCDGFGNCVNWEDENENICSKNTCPDYAFRCSYGACIDGDKKCNGIKDCIDNSDESTEATCFKPRSPIQLLFDKNCGEFDWPDTKKPFPWHAAIWLERNEGPERICAATIITKHHIISAVECFWDFERNQLSDESYTVTAGIRDETFLEFRKIKTIDYHNTYDSNREWQKKSDNIALITLQEPFVFDEFIQAACVNNEPVKLEIKEFVTVSWIVNFGGPVVSTPQQITLGERNKHCWSIIDEKLVRDSLFEDKLLCTVANECGHETDQGAGLFDFINRRYYLRGVLTSENKVFPYCNYQIFTNLNSDIGQIRTRIYNDNICSSEQFYCKSEKCIDIESVCDKKFDCEDESDESYINCLQPSFPIVLPEQNFTCGEFDNEDVAVPFPWHVAVWQEDENGPQRICAATIVTPRHVLANVECFWDPIQNQVRKDNFTITAGFNGRFFSEFRSVRKINYDPEYSYFEDWQQRFNNIAVLELETGFEFNENIQPACLDGRPQHEQTYFSSFVSEMVSWQVPSNESFASGPQRIMVLAPTVQCWETIEPNNFYRPGSDLLCSRSDYCGHQNDIGAGSFTKTGGKYYYRSMVTYPPRLYGNPYMPCDSRLHSSIIPNIAFIEKQIFNDTNDIVEDKPRCDLYDIQCANGKCISELQVCNNITNCDDGSDEKPEICGENVSVLFDNCGKFDTVNDTKMFPWHVAVWKETGEKPRRICSGTIISPEYVISAVDCFWNTINDNLNSNNFTVTAGYVGATFQQFRAVAKIFADDYNMRNGSRVHINNIALLKLKKSFDFNENVNAVCVTPRFKNKMYLDKNDPPGKFVGWLPNGFAIGSLVFLRNWFCRKNIPSYYLPNDESKMCTSLSPCMYILHYVDKAVPYNGCREFDSNLIGVCALPSNHGGGLFIKLNDIYYLRGVLDPAFEGYYTDACKYNIYNNIGPFIDFLYSIVE